MLELILWFDWDCKGILVFFFFSFVFWHEKKINCDWVFWLLVPMNCVRGFIVIFWNFYSNLARACLLWCTIWIVIRFTTLYLGIVIPFHILITLQGLACLFISYVLYEHWKIYVRFKAELRE